ncbi:hypothetical protein HETIRDRAFT_430020 [Heterobasidion irregulare TC 32-1]|uniref:Uncharacterized protein n=1 Tax=Heterobasidion irregulare (strain TC 32-1) TaxID=747525 RepID=W4JSY1_HETIT|nr:uncharacterized protein HETIRDRAFT_430020 [Heterobasidion irregulare TC 32-1]ETW76648.1 hypothetical protein HETIRDRAFT_430020 [Heterobasidion irregulare TC 32-1]
MTAGTYRDELEARGGLLGQVGAKTATRESITDSQAQGSARDHSTWLLAAVGHNTKEDVTIFFPWGSFKLWSSGTTPVITKLLWNASFSLAVMFDIHLQSATPLAATGHNGRTSDPVC